MSEALLSIICPPALEQNINDWLLEQKDMPGFTSMHVFGHGSKPETLSVVERVEGRKKQIMFQLHLNEDEGRQLINQLQQDFNGTNIHYWLVPVIACGDLKDNSDSSY